MLHITNGTSVSLPQTRLGGTVIYWNDVLHEGPVPEGLSFEEMTRVRGHFLAAFYGLPEPDGCFEERNQALRGYGEHDEVILWFEHDLYDQLQLIQILDWFSRATERPSKLTLVSTDRYLGMLQPDELESLFETRRAVTDEQIEIAQAAWEAFCAPEPNRIESMVRSGSSALPYLAPALRRHLEQFPSIRGGLSRTERQILESIDSGLHGFHELFKADQDRDEFIFMGDTTFRSYLKRLATSRRPLIAEREPGRYELTGMGRAVLAGDVDHVRENGINRWLGGVHLCEGAPVWRWDAARSQVTLI